ncbi:hypothetical protein TrRE_jg5896 [Triparma retinervis]|uniref:Uncharacterized protein n=1 Tax=Triparma retinervis TaxID=2557542 RepID=A0A9W7G3C9_9STRA|nr:hypothetical protein TrRE_jg5896 [Triparma retinervis]
MEQSKQSLRAFRSQYIASAAVMCDWLDSQQNKGVLGVHAALRALGQIVDDVTDRQNTLVKAAGDAIGVEHDVNDERVYWTREVVSMSRVGEVNRLRQLKDELEEKWTQCQGGGYTPSAFLGGSSDSGALMAVMGEQGHEALDKEKESEGDMWNDLEDLTNFEEGLVLKWRKTAVESDKKLRAKQNYAPPKAEHKTFLKTVEKERRGGMPVTLRYQPHPHEVAEFHEVLVKSRVTVENSKEGEASDVLAANFTMEDEVEAAKEVGEDHGDDIARLQKLHTFRKNKRQELFDTTLNGGKYDALKMADPGVWFDDDDEDGGKGEAGALERRLKKGDDDMFARAEEKAKKKRIEKMHELANRQLAESQGKFPFRLNRFTLDEKMRPTRLWKGGTNATDIPPLVDGKDDAKEVSQVALVIPTQFMGRTSAGMGAHKLLKKPSVKMPYNDSPCLTRADMDEYSMAKLGRRPKIPTGNPFDSHACVEPETTSDIDIRRYASNWGPILGGV